MSTDNKNFREAAHIGEEILNERDAVMRGKFNSVHDTVAKKKFTLDKALKLYKMAYEDYPGFLVKM